MATRLEQLKMPKMEKPKDSGHLDFYNDFPLAKCKVGETIELTVKVKVTSIHSDRHSSGIGFEIQSVKKY